MVLKATVVLSDVSPDIAFRAGVLITRSAIILLCDWVQDPTFLSTSSVMPEDLSTLHLHKIGVLVMVTVVQRFFSF